MRAVEPGAGLRLLEDGKSVPTLLLVVVNRPAGVDPVPELQQLPELVWLASDDLLKGILAAQPLQAWIVVVLDGRKYLRGMKPWPTDGGSHDFLRCSFDL